MCYLKIGVVQDSIDTLDLLVHVVVYQLATLKADKKIIVADNYALAA